jgi:anti-sigma factor RsiW
MKDHPSQWIHSGLTCRDVAEWATDYLEDRLPALTAIRIGLHVTSCAHCRAYVKQIDLVSSALRRLPKLYPSPVNRLRLSERFAGRHAN